MKTIASEKIAELGIAVSDGGQIAIKMTKDQALALFLAKDMSGFNRLKIALAYGLDALGVEVSKHGGR